MDAKDMATYIASKAHFLSLSFIVIREYADEFDDDCTMCLESCAFTPDTLDLAILRRVASKVDLLVGVRFGHKALDRYYRPWFRSSWPCLPPEYRWRVGALVYARDEDREPEMHIMAGQDAIDNCPACGCGVTSVSTGWNYQRAWECPRCEWKATWTTTLGTGQVELRCGK
jgi:hypothetical protein